MLKKQQRCTLLFFILLAASMLVQANDNSIDMATMLPTPVQNTNNATQTPPIIPQPSSTQSIPNQKRLATVLTCSDSPRHTGMVDKIPASNLFMISNIGNQLTTSLGSVDYGVNYLGSSLILIIGHSNCKAIHTATNSDYPTQEVTILKDLSTIHVTKGAANSDNVKMNINNQVAIALKRFASKVKAGELLVVGAVFETNDETPEATGKLNIININGETNQDKLNSIAATVAKAE